MSNIVKIRPIKKVTWSGFVRYKNTKDYIVPHFDSGGTIVTGLNKEDEKRLSELLKRDLSPSSIFWRDYAIVMTEKEKELNIDNPEHELAYKLMLAHMRVANSETERHLWPAADYVIYNEETDAKVKNEKFSAKRKAVTLFNELTPIEMRNILKLYPGFVNTESVSMEIVEAKLFEFVEANPDEFVAKVKDKKLEMKIFLKDLVSSRILRKNKTSFYYGDDFLGHDEESTISYLDDLKNQDLKIDLKQQLQKAKG
jgi:hypothetical protein